MPMQYDYSETQGPYGGLFDTSGPGDDDADDADDIVDEQIAEEISEDVLDSAGIADTGALMLPTPGELMTKVEGAMSRLFNGRPAPPKKVRKVAKKVKAKINVKAPARAQQAQARPAPRPATRPQMGRMQFPSSTAARKPITSVHELMQRVDWAQLASLTSTTVNAGVTSAGVQIPVTRDGFVLDWIVNNAAAELLASNLTYGQIPNTIFNQTPLGAWSPLAANHSPVDPVEVRQGANFNVTLFNPTAQPILIAWTLSGIPAASIRAALRDPDVRQFLQDRGLEVEQYFAG